MKRLLQEPEKEMALARRPSSDSNGHQGLLSSALIAWGTRCITRKRCCCKAGKVETLACTCLQVEGVEKLILSFVMV